MPPVVGGDVIQVPINFAPLGEEVETDTD